MPDRTSPFPRLLREPLVHFLLLGAILFAAFHWTGGSNRGTNRIVITPGQVDSIVAGFARTWQRPPTEEELKAELDQYVRDEIATREALAMGLEKDDTIIRRRLRQKFEFLAGDAAELVPPTDGELQTWLDGHADDYRIEPRVAFRQVMLSRELRGASLDADARALAAKLTAAGSDAKIDELGDSVMLPTDMPLTTRADVARQFGDDFASALLKLEPGRWSGPIESGYGAHVVLVLERVDGGVPSLADVRPQVERDFSLDRQKRQLDEVYAKLLERYTVVIEKRPQSVAPSTPSGEAAK